MMNITSKISRLPVLKIGVKNRNRRIYNLKTVNEIVNNFNTRKDTGYIFYGELLYKDTRVPSTSFGKAITETSEVIVTNYNTISYSNISHIIDKIYIDGTILYADIYMVESENGIVAESMLECDLLVLRPRTFSNVEEHGFVNFLQLITFDLIKKETDAFKGLI